MADISITNENRINCSFHLKAVIISFSLLPTIFFSMNSSALELISHRGNCCGQIENSLLAIESAWEVKADAVEVDVRMSKDDILLLFHDKRLNGKEISSMLFSEIHQKNNAIPTLTAILNTETPAPSGYYILDLKESSSEFLNVLVNTLKTNNNISKSRLAFQSSQIESLKFIKESFPESRYIFLSKLKRSSPFFTVPSAEELNNTLIENGINHVSIKGRKFIDKNYIDLLKKSNVTVFVWTINSTNRMNHYAKMGVDGVITDEIMKAK